MKYDKNKKKKNEGKKFSDRDLNSDLTNQSPTDYQLGYITEMCFGPYLANGWTNFDKIWFRGFIDLLNVIKQNSAQSVKNCGKSIFFFFFIFSIIDR